MGNENHHQMAMMSSKEKKKGFLKQKRWCLFGLKNVVLCGFFLCMRASSVKGGGTVCLTDACSYTASTMLKNMDPKINPCTDFYEFACGGFQKSTTIPNDTLYVDYAKILNNEIREKMTRTLAAEINPTEPKYVKLAKKLYKSCISPASSGVQGLEELKQYLRRLGGWPVLDGETWNSNKFYWRRLIYQLRNDADWILENNIGGLIRRHIEIDLILPKRIITLTEPMDFLWRGVKEVDFNPLNSYLRRHYNFLVDLAVDLGADRVRASTELRETISFEIKLANIKSLDNNSRTYKPTTIGQLIRKYPSVPWIEYIKGFVAPNVDVTEYDVIDVRAPEYYVKLERLIANTPERVQANYVFSRLAIRNAIYASNELRQRVYDYLSLAYRILWKRNQTRWCTNQVMANFKLGISGIYENNFISKLTKESVEEIIVTLKEETNEKLLKNHWMDSPTKSAGIRKLDALGYAVGCPDEVLKEQELDKFYKDLEFDENNFFGNMNNLTAFDHRIRIQKLREPADTVDWTNANPSTTVNAYYSPMANSIGIFGGMLHGLYFDTNRPSYLNYGAIGSSIGNELTHAFLGIGQHFDEDGYQDWWRGTTEANFQNRTQCIIDQYKNYANDVTGLSLKDSLRLEENMADIGGTRLAYDAYKKWARQNRYEQKLPGLEKYSSAQMFWISSASVWCAQYNEDFKSSMKNGDHSINKFRVIGSFSNMPEFMRDFQCPESSEMNRKNKCIVW